MLRRIDSLGRRVSQTLSLAVSLCLADYSFANVCEHRLTEFRCVEYVRNYDGDTATFNIPGVHPLFGKNISVRIKGIDTAEARGRLDCERRSARTAKKLVESVLRSAKTIELKNVERDKYFRVLADVVADGRSLADILVKNRLAVFYDGGTKARINWCEFGG